MLYCVYVGHILTFSSSTFEEAVENLGRLMVRKRQGGISEEVPVFLVKERTVYDEDGEEHTESDRLILSWEK